jgi:hypothetical protein
MHNYVRHLVGLEPDADPPIEAPHTGADLADKAADILGYPRPETTGERIGTAAVAGIPSALLAPEAPLGTALSGALGGASSQTVKEAGGSPLAQTVAGVAGGSLPAIGTGVAAGARGLARGGEAGRAALQANIDNAAANDVPLTVGQATGNGVIQRVEGVSRTLWGGGSIGKTAESQNQALSNRVDQITDNLAKGTDASPTAAGNAITSGVESTRQTMRNAESAAYDKVDALVPPDTQVGVSSTLAKLKSLTTPTPGAESTSAALIPPKIKQLADNLASDTEANGGKLPYETVKALRTAVGNEIDRGFAPANPAQNNMYKQLYGALSDDMQQGATSVSPEAAKAAKDASALYASNKVREGYLDSVVSKNGGPEAVYNAALANSKDGATKIGKVMGALGDDQQNVVRATVIDKLGRALPGSQNAAGDAFDASRFLTNWSKMSPDAKDALFGASGSPKTLRDSLDSLTKTMETLRNADALKNPSGTAATVGHGLGLAALYEAGTQLLSGDHHTALAAGGAVAGNYALAKALTNPKTAQWLATTSKLPPSSLPTAITQLGQSHDQDSRDLAAYLQQINGTQ